MPRLMNVDPDIEETSLEEKQIDNDSGKIREMKHKYKLAAGGMEEIDMLTPKNKAAMPKEEQKDLSTRLSRLNKIADEYQKKMVKPTELQKEADKPKRKPE